MARTCKLLTCSRNLIFIQNIKMPQCWSSHIHFTGVLLVTFLNGPPPLESKFYFRYRTKPEKSPRTMIDFLKKKKVPPPQQFLITPLVMRNLNVTLQYQGLLHIHRQVGVKFFLQFRADATLDHAPPLPPRSPNFRFFTGLSCKKSDDDDQHPPSTHFLGRSP